MTPDKDAMALALLDAEIASCGRLEPENCENCARIREARNHLADRLRELEADNERLRGAFDTEDEKASVHWYGEWVEQKRRAERAEAELAGVREDKARLDALESYVEENDGLVLHTGDCRGNYAGLSAGVGMRTLRQAIDSMRGAAIDAARGT